MKTLLVLDDYTEVLPEQEMESDTKKAFKEMADAVAALARHAAYTAETAKTTATSSSVEGKLKTLDERSKWHQKIGLGITSLYLTAFVGIVTFWIPREVATARDGITDAVKLDMAAQILPLQLQLAKLNALVELKQSKDVAEAIHQSADFSIPRPAIEAIKAIAQQAKTDKLTVSPSVLQQASAKIQEAALSDPQLKVEAWSARIALVDYRSSLQKPFAGDLVHGGDEGLSFPAPKLPVVGAIIFRDGHQKLDGFIWKNTVFENMLIEYDGGQMAMQNVRFINCTFTMKYTPRSDKFANLILDQKEVSGSLS